MCSFRRFWWGFRAGGKVVLKGWWWNTLMQALTKLHGLPALCQAPKFTHPVLAGRFDRRQLLEGAFCGCAVEGLLGEA
jgi:hypothetical protein